MMKVKNVPKIGIMVAIINHTISGCGLVERNQTIIAFRAIPTTILINMEGNNL